MFILSFLMILNYLYKNIILMTLRFFKKRIPKNIKVVKQITNIEIEKSNEDIKEIKPIEGKKNKKEKKQETMDFNDKMKQVEETLVAMEPKVKVVKSDKGLIERTESSKIVLTEDNRQLLND